MSEGSTAPLAAWVRRHRVARGWDQKQLAQAAGVAPSTMSDLEAGKRTPSVDTLTKVARALGQPATEALEVAGIEPFAPVAPRVAPTLDDIIAAVNRLDWPEPSRRAATRLLHELDDHAQWLDRRIDQAMTALLEQSTINVLQDGTVQSDHDLVRVVGALLREELRAGTPAHTS